MALDTIIELTNASVFQKNNMILSKVALSIEKGERHEEKEPEGNERAQGRRHRLQPQPEPAQVVPTGSGTRVKRAALS